MPQLSAPEVAYLVQQHWGATSDARGQPEDATAVAIVMCESSGVTNAVGDGDGNEVNGDVSTGNSYGLFQIHWPTWGDKLPQVSGKTDYFDPNVNVRAAHYIWQQAGAQFTDWTCYNSGGYLRHMSEARDAVAQPSRPGDVTVTGEDAPNPNPVDAVPFLDVANTLTDEQTWIRVGMFVGGAIVIIIGLVMAIGPTVAENIPAGRLAKRLGGGIAA